MKLLIAGSRSIKTFDFSKHIPEETDLIICGGANGIDRLAEQYADRKKISKLVLRPQYKRYGKGAPLKRNEIMVNLADKILIVWDGISSGSKYTADYAIKQNKPIEIITIDNHK